MTLEEFFRALGMDIPPWPQGLSEDDIKQSAPISVEVGGTEYDVDSIEFDYEGEGSVTIHAS